MKFLKLLDPWETQEGAGLLVEEQQRQAAELFPKLVNDSRLHYWRPGDAIVSDGERYLIGLAASFDLRDLRLADIINELLSSKPSVRVDVFNVEDCSDTRDIRKYFPGFDPPCYSNPWVGRWENGVHKATRFSFKARSYILESLGSTITAAEAGAGLCPPDPSLMDD